MPLADHHDVIKAFPSNRFDHPLRIGVLPRRSQRNDHLAEVQHPGLPRKSLAIDLVSIPDQMPSALALASSTVRPPTDLSSLLQALAAFLVEHRGRELDGGAALVHAKKTESQLRRPIYLSHETGECASGD
jgi:hypothetical protein